MTTGAIVAATGVGFTFLLNFAGLVWGASTMNSAIKNLDTVTGKLADSVNHLEKTVGRLDTRVTVLEDRSEKVG